MKKEKISVLTGKYLARAREAFEQLTKEICLTNLRAFYFEGKNESEEEIKIISLKAIGLWEISPINLKCADILGMDKSKVDFDFKIMLNFCYLSQKGNYSFRIPLEELQISDSKRQVVFLKNGEAIPDYLPSSFIFSKKKDFCSFKRIISNIYGELELDSKSIFSP